MGGAPLRAQETVLEQPAGDLLGLRDGARIGLMGGELADAIGRDAWLETLLRARHPGWSLSFHPLPFGAGDLDPARKQDRKGTPVDVLLLFLGIREAGLGQPERERFLSELPMLLRTLRLSFGEDRPARVILVGPPARERHPDRRLGDPASVNAARKELSEGLAAVAREADAGFVDLFELSQKMYATGEQKSALLPRMHGGPQSAFSWAGIRWKPEGLRLLAGSLFSALTGSEVPEFSSLEAARTEILLRNEHEMQKGQAEVRRELQSLGQDPEKAGAEMDRLLELAKSPDAAVRLAVLENAAVFAYPDAPSGGALGLVHAVLSREWTPAIAYAADELLAQLEPDRLRMRIPEDPKAREFVLGRLSNEELTHFKNPTQPVWQARIDREGMDPAEREKALSELADLRGTSSAVELLRALERADAVAEGEPSGRIQHLLGLLSGTPAAKLAGMSADWVQLAGGARHGEIRRGAWMAAFVSAESVEEIWKNEASAARLAEFLEGLPQWKEDALRSEFQPLLSAILRSDKSPPDRLLQASVKALPSVGDGFAKANFQLLAGELLWKRHIPLVVATMASLPKESWTGPGVPVALESILEWARSVPEASRGTPEFAATLQTAEALAKSLPEKGEEYLSALKEITAPVPDGKKSDAPAVQP